MKCYKRCEITLIICCRSFHAGCKGKSIQIHGQFPTNETNFFFIQIVKNMKVLYESLNTTLLAMLMCAHVKICKYVMGKYPVYSEVTSFNLDSYGLLVIF